MGDIPNAGHRVPKPIPIEETVYSYLIVLYGEEDVEKFPLEYPEDRMSLRILGKNVLLLLSAHSADESLALLSQRVVLRHTFGVIQFGGAYTSFTP